MKPGPPSSASSASPFSPRPGTNAHHLETERHRQQGAEFRHFHQQRPQHHPRRRAAGPTTATSTYINATGVPAYPIGPWPATNTPSNQNILARFPRTPQAQSGTHPQPDFRAIGPLDRWRRDLQRKGRPFLPEQRHLESERRHRRGPSFDSTEAIPHRRRPTIISRLRPA